MGMFTLAVVLTVVHVASIVNGQVCSIDNCEVCKSATKCRTCADGYMTLDRGLTCEEPPACMVDNCVQCRPGKANKCKRCEDGYKVNRAKRCKRKAVCGDIDNCLRCKGRNRKMKCKECDEGFSLARNKKSCQDVDECSNTDFCDANAVCSNTDGGAECTCNDGFTGDGLTCTVDVVTCSTDNGGCDINAECSIDGSEMTCTCDGGYSGDGITCSDDDECTSNTANCDSNAACSNTDGGFTCTCNSGYSGDGTTCTDDDECTANTDNCDINAACSNTDGGFTCTCNSGYSGDGTACTDVDECSANTANCDVNAVCSNIDGGFTCECNSGYSGDGYTCNDIDECTSSHSCAANAECSNTDGEYSCTCNDGFSGDGFTCNDIDECSANTANCDTNAACSNTDGGFTCACNSGYSGDGYTCDDVDECASNSDTCASNAECSNTEGGFTCACNSGYSGDGYTCDDIDECAINTDNCDANADCSNADGGFTCACNSGYSGDGYTCDDIDECTANTDNCDTNAACSNTDGGFTCACNSGFSGDGYTCDDIDECSTNNGGCNGNAACSNNDGGFTCACNSGYSGNGYICEDEDECTANTANCDSNAVCANIDGGFTCTCNYGYSGDGHSCTQTWVVGPTTYGGNADGASCVFPFFGYDTEYSECTAEHTTGYLWCSTTPNYDTGGQWGKCPGGCIGHDSCCTGGVCGVNEGDCDTDSDCRGDLVCGTDNCDGDSFDATDDCCAELPTGSSVCSEGVAITGNNNLETPNVPTIEECIQICLSQTTFACRSLDYNAGSGMCKNSDDSHFTIPQHYNVYNGWSYCAVYPDSGCTGGDSCCTGGNCGINEGDCDADSDCQGGLVCGSDNCQGDSFDSTDNCCSEPTGSSVCVDGEAISGNNNREISNTATREICVHRCLHETSFTCRSVDYHPDTGMCKLSVESRHSVPNSFNVYSAWGYCDVYRNSGCTGGDSCCTGGNCGINEGDCDADSDCQGGLVCGSDNCQGDSFDSTDDCCSEPPPPATCAIMYRDGIDSDSLEVIDGDDVAGMPSGWNDVVSAARVSDGCTLSMYQHGGFRGEKKMLTAGEYNNSPTFSSYNDVVSSYRCTCGGYCATMFRDGLDSAELVVADGQEQSSMPSGWNDVISAVRVEAGCALTMYQDGELNGESKTVTSGEYPHSPTFTSYNDVVSSYRCSCGGSSLCSKQVALTGNNNRETPNIATQEECVKLCLDETTFTCRSLDYNADSGMCKNSDDSHSTNPNIYNVYNGWSYCAVYSNSGCTGGDSCCTGGNCGLGEGDCDADSDCQSGLVCGTDNCNGDSFQDTDDCCMERTGTSTCYDGYGITGNNNREIQNTPTREQCVQLCLRETDFTCISTDYNAGSGMCKLSVQSHLTIPNSYRTYNGWSYCYVVRD